MKLSVTKLQKNKRLGVSKFLVFTITAFYLMAFTSAQKVKVPESVLKSFHSRFPNSKKVKWEKENSYYEVVFKCRKNNLSAVFNDLGLLLETESEIKINTLPKPILEYIESHYKIKDIKEAAQIVDFVGVSTFEVEIHGKDLIFSREGKFLKAN